MRTALFIIFCFLLSFYNLSLQAQPHLNPQEDSVRSWERIYSRALLHLKSSSGKKKLEAAYILGTQRNPRFLGPLIEELRKDLSPEKRMVHAEDEAHVKSAIAWAIGHIGHPIAVSSLLKALDSSIQIAQAEIKKAQEKSTQNQDPKLEEAPKEFQVGKVRDIIIKPTQAGPFWEHRKNPGFYYNADKYWSLSDKLQRKGTWLSLDRPHEIARFGENYINLARSILMALGKIKSQRAVEKISFYLNSRSHPSAIRTYAGLALGDIGETKALEKLVQAFEKEKIPLVRISMAYAILRNDKARFSVYKSLLSFLKMGSAQERLAAAQAFEKLAMGEALENLKAAHLVENEMHIRLTLKRAIYKTKQNLLRVYFRAPSA